MDLNCEDGFTVIQTETKPSKSISYKIVYSHKSYTKESSEFYEGLIVLSGLIDRLSPKEVMETIGKIGIKNKLNKIVAFRTCHAVELYGHQTNLDDEQKKYLENNIIAKMEIDLNATLTKKDKKKYARKRKLLELLSQESCEEFNRLNSNNLNIEQFNKVLVEVMVQNSKKIEKAYDKHLEELMREYVEDLIYYLKMDCEIVKQLIKKHK